MTPGGLDPGLGPHRVSPATVRRAELSGFLKILVSTRKDSNYVGDKVKCYVRREGGQGAE